MDDRRLRAFAEGGVVNTDDNLHLRPRFLAELAAALKSRATVS